MERVELGGSVRPTGGAVLRIKHNFSHQHMRAASFFASQAQLLEEPKEPPEPPDTTHHRAHVTGAILSSVAFLEASINELYLAAIERDINQVPQSSETLAAEFAEFWEEVERFAIPKKYQVALLLFGKERLPRGQEPYQEADSLVHLRNALVHYQPEWDDENGVHQSLHGRLSGRFDLNPLAQPSSLWFPHLCLSAGCAVWAVEVVRRFSSAFCARAELPVRAG